MYGLKDFDLFEIVKIIKEYKVVEEIILFGSRAKGNYKNGSDVDLAIKGKVIDRSVILEISSKLNEESLLPYKFDIINYQKIDSVDLREHIDRVGKVIFCKEDGEEFSGAHSAPV